MNAAPNGSRFGAEKINKTTSHTKSGPGTRANHDQRRIHSWTR